MSSFSIPCLVLSLAVCASAISGEVSPEVLDPIFERKSESQVQASSERQHGFNVASVWLRWFDIEGRLGLQRFFQNPKTSSYTLVVPISEESFLTNSSGFSHYTTTEPGSPIYAELILGTEEPEGPLNKRFGVYSTVEGQFSSGYWQGYSIPSPGHATITSGLGRDVIDDNYIAFSIDLSIVDSRYSPSLMAPATVLDDISQRRIHLRVDYLEGNALEERGFDEKIFPVGNPAFGDSYIFVAWGGDNGNPWGAYFLTEPPVGDMLISLSIDGFSTDTVRLNAEAGYRYDWTAGIPADLGADDSITLYGLEMSNFPMPPPFEVLEIGLERAILFDVLPIVFLDEPTDPNADQIRDVADFVRLGFSGQIGSDK